MTEIQPTRQWRYMVFALVLLAGSGLSIFSYSLLNDSTIMAEGEPLLVFGFFPATWVRPLMMFVAMVVGMFFNQLFENLKAQKAAGRTTIHVFQTFASGWKGISFWMALVVSPIIFYGTYFIGDALPDGNVAWFYAFQNGFFWYNIFHKVELKGKSAK